MLVLTRKVNEKVVIQTTDGLIAVQVLSVDHTKMKIGIDAPESVKILRSEIIGREAQQQ